ncbi:hypothetical protein ACQKFO_21335 [Rossellomorea sp. NPDC071047]|uniref:hypothetical protein n=1 Tax=Rossellomorea sp. NPDC071047 TaxID=3390675 RepID=UPI003D0231F2
MNKSIATFMGIAITVILMISLVITTSYAALKDKNDRHHNLLETKHQLKEK